MTEELTIESTLILFNCRFFLFFDRAPMFEIWSRICALQGTSDPRFVDDLSPNLISPCELEAWSGSNSAVWTTDLDGLTAPSDGDAFSDYSVSDLSVAVYPGSGTGGFSPFFSVGGGTVPPTGRRLNSSNLFVSPWTLISANSDTRFGCSGLKFLSCVFIPLKSFYRWLARFELSAAIIFC